MKTGSTQLGRLVEIFTTWTFRHVDLINFPHNFSCNVCTTRETTSCFRITTNQTNHKPVMRMSLYFNACDFLCDDSSPHNCMTHPTTCIDSHHTAFRDGTQRETFSKASCPLHMITHDSHTNNHLFTQTVTITVKKTVVLSIHAPIGFTITINVVLGVLRCHSWEIKATFI